MAPGYDEILTSEAMAFVATLNRAFNARRIALLERRAERQQAFDAGQMPDFLPETARYPRSDWTVAPIPADLQDRRVEITGPVDRKMVINALNSGAKVFMADFEDANSPTWDKCSRGRSTCATPSAARLALRSPEGKQYTGSTSRSRCCSCAHAAGIWTKSSAGRWRANLRQPLRLRPVLLPQRRANCWRAAAGRISICPRWKATSRRGCGTTCSCWRRRRSACRSGTIKATVLIETIPAAFEMDEILYELREHSAGLNCGRWDYIFSFIKKLRNDPDVHPARSRAGDDDRALHARVLALLSSRPATGAARTRWAAWRRTSRSRTIRRRTRRALAKVRADKQREADDGHDGTWVAHPGLVPMAKEIFDQVMPQPNQIRPHSATTCR